MPSIAETFWQELTARIVAAPSFGIDLESIRRKHRTPVTRARCPAVQVIEGAARLTEVKRCDWRFEMNGTIRVFVRDDDGLEAADPFVVEIVKRINPEIPTAYSNGVLLEITALEPEVEIADEDAVATNIELRARFGCGRWALDAAT